MGMEEQNRQYRDEDEITLKDIFVATRKFVLQALGMWWVFAGLFLVIGGYLVYDAWTTPVTYKAKLTFMVNEDEGNSMSGVSSILGQFGFAGRRGRFNLDKIVELSRSQTIVQRTVLSPATVNGEVDLIGNHLIEIYTLDEEWAEKDENLEGFRFASKAVSDFDTLGKKALKKVVNLITGGEDEQGLMTNSYSEESTILTLTAETENEDLSIAIVSKLFDVLSQFYVEQAIERQKITFNIVKAKVDSIGEVLANTEYAYANFRDQNQNLALNVARLREMRLQRDIQKLNVMHAEALKNLEIADFSLRNATPFIQEIDHPIPPLTPQNPSKMKAAIIGMVIAILIGSMYIVGRNVWVQLLQEE